MVNSPIPTKMGSQNHNHMDIYAVVCVFFLFLKCSSGLPGAEFSTRAPAPVRICGSRLDPPRPDPLLQAAGLMPPRVLIIAGWFWGFGVGSRAWTVPRIVVFVSLCFFFLGGGILGGFFGPFVLGMLPRKRWASPTRNQIGPNFGTRAHPQTSEVNASGVQSARIRFVRLGQRRRCRAAGARYSELRRSQE